MRLDLLLKQTTLIKRRTIAKQLIEMGKVLVNGKEAKPSYEVKEDDLLTLKLGNREIVVRIFYEQVGKRILPKFEQISVGKTC